MLYNAHKHPHMHLVPLPFPLLLLLLCSFPLPLPLSLPLLQGVEERACKDARDIFNILENTNKQRRTAETLCNKQSSRSHQVYAT